MWRWITIGVLSVALLAALVFAGFMWLEAGTQKVSARHHQARADFITGVAAENCLTVHSLQSAAKARGWGTRIDASNTSFIPPNASYSKDDIANTLVVSIDPPLPFSKGLGAFYHFDDQGCLLR